MAKPINMPKLSDEMTEGKIAEWLKNEGDEVKAGDVVAQVETEKATLDVEAFESGVLLGILVKKDETAPVGQPIAWIGQRGEQLPAAAPAAKPDAAMEARAGSEVSHPSTQPAPRAEAKRPAASMEAPAASTATAAAPSPSRGVERGGSDAAQRLPAQGARAAPAAAAGVSARVVASPAARKRARERGLELGGLQGSGPRGRIVLADVESAPEAGRAARPAAGPAAARGERAPAAAAPSPPARRRRELAPPQELRDETIALSPMRKAIARNLAVSKPGAPHFYLEISADMRRMVALREQLEELGQGPVSYNDLLVKAVADALERHPEVNASWGADAIVRYGSIDVGIAVAVEDGLMTPVVRDANEKSVFEIAAESRALATRARERKLVPEEYQGATFTISNLGMFGIEVFYAVINPPEAAILAVGALQKVPWVDDGTGQLVAMERLRLGLSGDHRVVDGATGARFLQTLKAVLESPLRLVVSS